MNKFRATVGDVLDIAALCFDNSKEAVARELAQNARRAGATKLEIENLGDKLVMRDNGPGCAPEDLFVFGSSFWASDIREYEMPAGIGFWSVALCGATVRCGRGWQLTVTREHFEGVADIEPRECPPQAGLGLEIAVTGLVGSLCPNRFRFYPFAKLLFNGSERDTGLPFLRRSVPVSSHPGYCYQVEMAWAPMAHVARDLGRVSPGTYTMELCYGGWTLCPTDYHNGPLGGVYQVDAAGRLSYVGSALVLVDVSNERLLPLTLPQRDGVVVGDEWKLLMRRVYQTYVRQARALDDRLFCSVWTTLKARKTVPDFPFSRYAGILVSRKKLQEDSDAPGEMRVSANWSGRLVEWEEALQLLKDGTPVVEGLSTCNAMDAIIDDAASCGMSLLMMPRVEEADDPDLFEDAPPFVWEVVRLADNNLVTGASICCGQDTLLSDYVIADGDTDCYAPARLVDDLRLVLNLHGETEKEYPLDVFIPTMSLAVLHTRCDTRCEVPFYVRRAESYEGVMPAVDASAEALVDFHDNDMITGMDADPDVVIAHVRGAAMRLVDSERYVTDIIINTVRKVLAQLPDEFWKTVTQVVVTAGQGETPSVELVRGVDTQAGAS